jgi:hypothetical protein
VFLCIVCETWSLTPGWKYALRRLRTESRGDYWGLSRSSRTELVLTAVGVALRYVTIKSEVYAVGEARSTHESGENCLQNFNQEF